MNQPIIKILICKYTFFTNVYGDRYMKIIALYVYNILFYYKKV
jgi:hypothetical protein